MDATHFTIINTNMNKVEIQKGNYYLFTNYVFTQCHLFKKDIV